MTNSEQYIKRLRDSGLRPTKQRVKISEVLFASNETFHFTIKDLAKMIGNKANIKVSLATVYNTVTAFKKKGYLKEIAIISNQRYQLTHHKVILIQI